VDPSSRMGHRKGAGAGTGATPWDSRLLGHVATGQALHRGTERASGVRTTSRIKKKPRGRAEPSTLACDFRGVLRRCVKKKVELDEQAHPRSSGARCFWLDVQSQATGLPLSMS
jgi:hypothetical protein